MTKREIASLACKILAVYALLQIPRYLQSVYFVLASVFTDGLPDDSMQFPWYFSAALVPTLLYLVVGILLWRRANALASRMVPVEQPRESRSQISGKEVSAIAFSVVGLVVMVHAIPRIAHILANAGFQPPAEFESRWTASTKAALVALAVQVVLGALLFTGGRALSRLVRTVRTTGQKSENDSS